MSGSPITAEISVTPCAVPEANEHVAGRAGVTCLDAVDPRHGAEQVVAADHGLAFVAQADRRDTRVDGPAEEREMPIDRREMDEVVGAGVRAGIVETDRAVVVRVRQAEVACAPVHDRDEVVHRPADNNRQRWAASFAEGNSMPLIRSAIEIRSPAWSPISDSFGPAA